MKVGAFFMNLSKVFDTLNHRLLLAKLKAYGLQPTALKQMENHLTLGVPDRIFLLLDPEKKQKCI